MKTDFKSYSIQRAVLLSIFAVSVLWVIQSAGVLFELPLQSLGVRPFDVEGVWKILTAPLVHGSYEHLFNNTLPLLVLGSALLYGYPRTRWWALVITWLVSGSGIFLFGRDSVHFGASGISHGLFFYLFVVSILRRDARSVGLMMIAFFMYGGMIMTIFPREPGISYEAHFFGAVGGAIAAVMFWRNDPKPLVKKYPWEEQDSDDPVIGDLWKQQHSSKHDQD
ncbi:rhomboid family intramembrane serine protease [Alteromonas ponticola]|uniref:Rhomboid family intramembrane serine protease n=1 Tax=Alteromonas aquimaris TaxID=2998417 RepID=A0ABT3P5W6_9ALTE|nr:rhomboid family intramembrane serine protease [Alteromonas aquimaris]MCW8108142.1 rhomboid family intramembrane serine protease [Alteromonas aquimaris]